MISLNFRRLVPFRLLVQWVFFGWIIGIGIRFALFVRHFESGGTAAYFARPPGVDGFLPIGGLASLKLWLTTGVLHPFHPAATVILLSIVAMSLFARKSFCSWLCPVGTLSEGAWKLAGKVGIRSFRMWRWLDVTLRGMKYLLLLFFLRIVWMGMDAAALSGFLDTPYYAVSDVKMLHFFTRMSVTAMVIVAILVMLSFIYKNFWCRYLCPYGALLGVVAVAGPFRIHRKAAECTACRRCSHACPSLLPVDEKARILSPECTGCLTCVDACPTGCLSMSTSFSSQKNPQWLYPAVALGVFAVGILAGMITGNWQSSLTYGDYQSLIPMVETMTH